MFRDDYYAAEDERVDIDSLFERNRQSAQRTERAYKNILSKVQDKIKAVSRQRCPATFCWYPVPVALFSSTVYNQADCTVYVISRLRDNGFEARFVKPNLILVSWANWVPAYAREAIFNKTGQRVDSRGYLERDREEEERREREKERLIEEQQQKEKEKEKEKKKYTPLEAYNKSVVYNTRLMENIQRKVDIKNIKEV